MKNLFLVCALVFAACSSATQTDNQQPEWNLGIYHGHIIKNSDNGIATILKLKTVGKTSTGLSDSVQGVYYFDSVGTNIDTVIHQIAGSKVVATTVTMYHGIQWAFGIYGTFAWATPPNSAYTPTQIILNPTLDSAIVVDPSAWRDTTLKKE